MSRRNWSPEQRAAAAARMRAMNADPAFQAAKTAASRRPENRAARAKIMRATVARIQEDPALKAKWLDAVTTARRDTDYRARAAEQMRAQLAEGGRGGRKAAPVPPGFEETYRLLLPKVGGREALRLVHEEARRCAERVEGGP